MINAECGSLIESNGHHKGESKETIVIHDLQRTNVEQPGREMCDLIESSTEYLVEDSRHRWSRLW